MGLFKTVSKAAGTAAVKKMNGGCPSPKSDNGKHKFKGEKMRDVLSGEMGVTVFYCKNPGCGRQR